MNHIEATARQLHEEAFQVQNNLNDIEYGPERRKQMETRLGMVALELLSRQLENQNHDPAATLAFLSVDYFGLSVEAKGLELGRANVQVQGV